MKYCINVPEYTFVNTPCVYEVIEVKEPIRVVEVKTREQERKDCYKYYNYCKYFETPVVKKTWVPKWLQKKEVEEVTFIDRYTILY